MLTLKELTKSDEWEKWLTQSVNGMYPFFQSWEWGNIEEKLGETVYRLGLFEEDVLIGVSLVILVTARRGHFLHVRHGPVLKEYTSEIMNAFLSYLRTIAKRHQCTFIRVSPLIPLDSTDKQYFMKKPWISAPIHNMDAEVCWVLNLAKSEEDILKEMRKSHRYLVRKSQTMDIKVIRTENMSDIDKFLNLYKDLAKRRHFVPHKGVVEEFNIFTKTKNAQLFLAQYEGKIIAGAFIVFVPTMAIYRHGASLDEYKHIPASYLLQWEAIKEAKKRGLKYYNFWGISPQNKPNHPWKGLTLFKTGFGGKTYEFLHAHDFPLRIDYMKSYAIEYTRKIIRGY